MQLREDQLTAAEHPKYTCIATQLNTKLTAAATSQMLAQLRRLYYWPGMRRDIDAWCRQCEGCAISRGPPSRPHGHLRKVYAGAPMDLVAIDVLSGLPTTPDGHKYHLVATDYFTKWLEAIPLCDAEAHTCMRALYSAFFSRFGLPRRLHSDQGVTLRVSW